MVQHYAKEHKDSDLERTKEDLLLYSSDELEEHYRNDVKVNWKTGMESCENFSNDVNFHPRIEGWAKSEMQKLSKQ